MTDAINKRIKTIEGQEANFFWLLFSGLVIGLILYSVFLIQIIMNGAESQALVKQIDLAKSEVEQIEYKYLALKNTINIDYASKLGFTQGASTLFVSLQPASNVAVNLNQ